MKDTAEKSTDPSWKESKPTKNRRLYQSRPRLTSLVYCHSHLAAEDNESRKNAFRQRGRPTTQLPRSRGSWEALKTGANILNSDDRLAT